MQEKLPLNTGHIIKTVCQYYGITKEKMLSEYGSTSAAIPRHMAVYLTKQLLPNKSQQSIATTFGFRSRDAAVRSIKRIERISADPDVARLIADLSCRITGQVAAR